MITFDVKLVYEKIFFDRPAVRKAIGEASARALSKIGAFVRTRARSLLRRRKRVSSPGSPPSVHSTDDVASLKAILFAYDKASQSVVIGPRRLNQTDFLNGSVGRGTVPQLHEFGGTRKIIEKRSAGGRKWYRMDRRRSLREGEITRGRTATYPPRPFMGPAMAAEIAAGTVSSAWRGTVKGN